MNTENEAQVTLKDLFNIFFKHKTKMIIIFVTVLVTVTIGTLLASPVYEAYAKIIIKFGREDVFTPTSPSASGNSILFDNSREERINSEIEIFKGRNLIEKVLTDMGVKTIYPAIDKKPLIPIPAYKKLSSLEKATLIFQRKFTVEGISDSNIIEIKFQHQDPVIASQVVNNAINVFLEHHLSVYKQLQQYSFFDEQVNLLTTKMETSEDVLEKFKSKNEISSLMEQKSLLLKQISDLEVGLAETNIGISELEGKMKALNGNPSATLAGLKMGEETDFNPQAISAIKTRLAELKLKEETLLSKYTPQSVMVSNVRKEIKRAQGLLANEEKTYHDKSIITITHTLNALKSKEKSQKKHLEKYKQELTRINSVELKLKELKRQVELDENNYQLYVKHMEEARISNAMDNEKIANVSIVEPASPPIKHIKPTRTLNILLAFILGGIAALGAAFFSEFLSHSFNNGGDVKRHLKLPVLASIQEMK